MRRHSVLVGSVFLLAGSLLGGCSGHTTPSAEPAAPSVAEAPAATAAEPVPEVALDATTELDGRQQQCAAGDTQTCLSLCQDTAAVCNKDTRAVCDLDKGTCIETRSYDKDKCDELAKDRTLVPLCSAGIAGKPGTLCEIPADQIAPTQSSVGQFAAECRARKIKYRSNGEERGKKNLRRYLLARLVPAVLGPDGRYFISDHHHLSTGVLKADIEEDRKNLYLCTVADKEDEGVDDFWAYMEKNNFTWLYDNRGQPIHPRQLPSDLAGLADDPYRTLSRWVRESCGYIKCDTVCGGDGGTRNTNELELCQACSVSPYFLEFRWANYFRAEMPNEEVYRLSGKEQARVLQGLLQDAMTSATQPKALEEGLPGWNLGLIQSQRVGFDPETLCDQ